jgi:hypothetical protein
MGVGEDKLSQEASCFSCLIVANCAGIYTYLYTASPYAAIKAALPMALWGLFSLRGSSGPGEAGPPDSRGRLSHKCQLRQNSFWIADYTDE